MTAPSFNKVGHFSIGGVGQFCIGGDTKSIRTNNPVTYVSRVWVWTQLIPLWNLVAFIMYNAKMSAAVAVYNNENNTSIVYPVGLGWAILFSFLYAWIPVFGWIAAVVVFIMFWSKVANVSAQAYISNVNARRE